MNRFREIAFTRRLPRLRIRDGMTLLFLVVSAWLLAQWFYRAPRDASFMLDVLPAVLPRAGLYELETFSDHPGIYRWTDGSAQIKLPNPGGPVLMRLVLAGGPGRTTAARVSAGAQTLAFDVRPEPRSYAFALPAGAGERITIALDTPTFRDGSRDLGLVLSDLAISGGDAVPLRLLPALALATAGLYLLLRRAGWSVAWAGGALLLVQALTLLWQSQIGWRYGLSGALLALVGATGLAAVVIERWWPVRDSSVDPRAALARRDAYIVAGLLALALCVRLPWLAAPDPVGDLELSARRMGFLRAEGLAGAYHDDGDYMPLRLYWLRGFSALPFLSDASFRAPLPPATLLLIKLPGVLADLATVALLYLWSRRWCAASGAAALAALYALAPPVWMNVAWWGQVDAVLVLPILLMLALLDRAGGRWSWACLVIALLIKPQAIIFAPVLFIATLRRYGCRGLLAGGGLAAALAGLGCAPLLLAGQGPGLLQAYIGSVGRFPQLTNRAYNLWYLVTLGAGGADVGQGLGPLSFRLIGVILMGGAALLVCVALIQRSDAAACALGAAVLALAFFTLPTQIHERYLFLALALLVMSAAADRTVLAAYVILIISATLNILGALRGFSEPAYAAIVASPLPLVLAALNVLVLLALMGWLLATLRTKNQEPRTKNQASSIKHQEPRTTDHQQRITLLAVKPEHRRNILVFLRVAVSAALLGYVLLNADLPSFVARWPGISQPLLALALALQLAGVFISSLKWWLLLRAAEQPVAYLWTVRTYLVGQFFSNFLPTSIGGDAVRVFRLNRQVGRLGLAIASVFVERITGFLALTIIGWGALGLNFERFDANWQLRWAMIGGLLAASGGLLVALSAPWTVGMLSRLPLPNVIDWRGKLRSMADALALFYADRGALALVMLLAFGYQLSWIAVNVAAAQALRMDVPWSFIALMVPISDIVGLIPIFFNNLGAREGIYTLLLGLLGLPAAQALALALLVFGARLLVSLLGGVVLLLESVLGSRRELRQDA